MAYSMISRCLTGPEFAFLRDEFLAHLYRRHPGFRPRRRLRPEVEAGALIPLSDVATETGMRPQSIIAYGQREAFRVVARPLGGRSGRRKWLVDIDGLRRFAGTHHKGRWQTAEAAARPVVPLTLAARMLGVTGATAVDMLSNGVLGEPVAGVQAHPQVRRRAIEELLSRLECPSGEKTQRPRSSSGEEAGRCAPLVRLTDHAGKRTGTLSALVRETLRSGLAPLATDDRAVGVRRFLFPREEVHRIADRAREAEGWATKKFVGTLLRGHKTDVDYLLAAGFLRAAPASNRAAANPLLRICSVSIAEFAAEFTTLGVISHAQNRRRSAVAAGLRGVGVEPVATAGARVPVFYGNTDLRRARIVLPPLQKGAASSLESRAAEPAKGQHHRR